jgi:hypothetical protein
VMTWRPHLAGHLLAWPVSYLRMSCWCLICLEFFPYICANHFHVRWKWVAFFQNRISIRYMHLTCVRVPTIAPGAVSATFIGVSTASWCGSTDDQRSIRYLMKTLFYILHCDVRYSGFRALAAKSFFFQQAYFPIKPNVRGWKAILPKQWTPIKRTIRCTTYSSEIQKTHKAGMQNIKPAHYHLHSSEPVPLHSSIWWLLQLKIQWT